MNITHVKGKNKGKIMLYALSTCAWCKKTKDLFDELGLEYQYIFVDQLDDDEMEEVVKELKKWNPRCSYPTIVINEKVTIVGFKEDEIREVLDK
jgi:glutaredoxin